ncbi:hypothetical protein EON83_00135 [bacterium]|nr:MAG: hypothetical protein EON83_00135 [bacterium]
MKQSLFAALQERFKSKPGKTVFLVRDLADMLGITPERINDAISKRPTLFPKGIGLEGHGCRREWPYEEALKVGLHILNLSPKAKANLGFACFAF